jgi:hypothetical protein
MERSEEVNHLEDERFGALVVRTPESDRQTYLTEGDKLLARDHYIQRVWDGFESVSAHP